MANSNNNQSQSLISSAVGVAKKLSSTGMDALNYVAPGTVAKLNHVVDGGKAIDGNASIKNPLETQKYENPQQMIRQHFPTLSHQFLGRHYNRVSSIANFLSPDINEKISDFFFTKLNDFSDQMSSVDKVLAEAGAKDLTELQKDPERSQRLSQALLEQNKLIAVVQGSVSGVTGVVGAAVDVPVSIILALRTVYQTGRAYGFELTREQEQEIVEFVFKEVDLGLVMEKQTLLAGIRTIRTMLQSNDLSQLQQLLGSSNDIDLLKHWLSDDQGQFKYAWLNGTPAFSFISKLAPLAGATVSAVYSWRLIEDAGQKAQAIFNGARHYLLQYPEQNLSPVGAYLALEKSLDHSKGELDTADIAKKVEILKKSVEVPESDTIIKATIQPKADHSQENVTDDRVDENVHEGLEDLAEKYVEPHEIETQKSAVADEEELLNQQSSKKVEDNQSGSEKKPPAKARTTKPRAKAKSTTITKVEDEKPKAE